MERKSRRNSMENLKPTSQVDIASLSGSKDSGRSPTQNRKGKARQKWFDFGQSKLLHDTMKVPAWNPRFPMPSADSAAMYSPSVDQLRIFQAGFLNRLNRADMWVLHYVVLTEEYIHFFSGAREDYLGHHDFQIPLRKVSAVDDGPALSGEFAKHGTVRLELMGTDRPMVLCAYDTLGRNLWKDSFETAVEAYATSNSVSGRSQSKSIGANGSESDDARECDKQSITVLAVTCVAPAGGDQAANPAWGNTVVRMTPSWGDTMTCRLEQGGHIRVWLSNGMVCCIDPLQKLPVWRDGKSLAPVEQPGFKLDYKVQGVSLGFDPVTPSDHKQQVRYQQAAYAVLVVLLNAALWGFVSPEMAYWASAVWMAAALMVGALPGPLATVSSHHPGGPVVKLHLTDCEADYECYSASGQELQRSLSRMDTMPKGGARVMVAKVDPMKLEQLRQTFPGESDVKLARFLIARKHVVEDAINMCNGDTNLRGQLGPITNADMLPFFKTGLVQVLGFAMDGTPLVYVQVKNLDNKLPSAGMQKLVLHVCDMAAAICPDQQCMTVLADLKGFSMSKNVDFQKTKDCVAVLNACLPEVLRRVFVVNSPFVFQAVWGFVQGLIDAQTADKVRILSAKSWRMMDSFIDPEIIPKELGGTNLVKYDSSKNSEAQLNWGEGIQVPRGF